MRKRLGSGVCAQGPRFQVARVLLALLFVFGLVGRALAQMETATLSGTVTDPTGAVVAGAEVRAVRIDTGTNYVSTTNTSGLYLIVGLQPGRFRIFVTKQGFKQIELTDVTLNVQDTVSRNFSLEVGAASETVTVRADDLHINTTDATVSTVVDRQFAENLPMNGRSFQTLIQLTPGVVLTSSTRFDSGQFSVNGQRPTSNYWMVDGVSANIGVGVNGSVGSPGFAGNGLGGTVGSFSAVGGTNSLVSVDAMQEFRIQTSTFAPEFGRTPGGQISIVTRSGTNQFHGSAFEYLRNDVLDANNWFNTSVTPALPKAKERNNDFGGTFSGPVFKDRTFFFFSYEGLRLRLPQTRLGFVPDLTTRQNATAAMQPFLNAFPLPNGTDNLATGIAQLNTSYSDPATLDAYSIRVDHRLASKWAIFGRYNYSPSEIEQRGANGGAVLSVIAKSRITTQTGTFGATWNIAALLINDARFNYSRTNAQGTNRLDNSFGAAPLSSLPFPSPFTAENGQFAVCSFVLTGGACLSAGANVQNIQRQNNVVDTVSWQKGSHALKFGADWRHLSPDSTPAAYVQIANFPNMARLSSGTPLFTSVGAFKDISVRFTNLGIYAQDTWHTTPRLTITYGLRWDVDFAPSSGNGLNLPAVTGYNLLDLSQLALAPVGTEPFATTFGNVAPRLGVAYQVFQNRNWQTVLRGGFGVFYDLVSSETGNLLGSAVNSPPFGNRPISFGGSFPLTPVQSQPPAIPATATLASLNAFNPNLKLPYTLEWNVALEQGLGTNQTLSLTYVGAAGRRLLQTSVFSPALTNLNVSASFVDNTATSDYDALQAQFQRRLSRRLQALTSYTWSHSIDDGSAGSFGSRSNLQIPGTGSQNRANSAFDIRHAFRTGLSYDIPSPRGNRLTEGVLRGWSVENLVQAQSAAPVDLSAAGFFAPFSSGASINVRPDVVPGQPFYLFGSQYPGGKAFNPAAFTKPPNGPISPTCPFGGCPARQGTLGRNVLRGFGATQWDLAIHREFPIHESLRLQFRAEMFNVINHPNFGPPSNGVGAAGFGVSTSTLNQALNGGTTGSNVGGGSFSPLYQIGGPRSIQFALKLTF